MTNTVQPSSLVTLNNTLKDIEANIPDEENNLILLLKLFDSMNKLQKTVDRLDYLSTGKK
jgi:UTP:GlnB (protein PII) uridylyltransferase